MERIHEMLTYHSIYRMKIKSTQQEKKIQLKYRLCLTKHPRRVEKVNNLYIKEVGYLEISLKINLRITFIY